MFRCRVGAVPRGGVCKTGEAPARGAARSAAGGRRRRPKAGDAFRGGGTRPVPLTQNLRGKYGTSPESFPAERVLPAPRAGERTLSAFLQWLHPLRPAPGTVRSRLRAGEILCVTTIQSSRAALAETPVPAPRAGERTLSAFFHWLRPLRPGSRNCPFPTRAGEILCVTTIQSSRAAPAETFVLPTRAGGDL